jgi:heat shock protein HslJ
MRLQTALFVLAVSLMMNATFLFGQTRDLSTGQQVLAETQWRLVSMGRVGAETNLASGTSVTLKFSKDGRISGSGGCNSYGGGYRVVGDQITFGQVFSTRRACLEADLTRQEGLYLSALGLASRFRLSSNRLNIYYEGGRSVLDFVRDPPPSDNEVGESDPIEALKSYYQAINAKDYERAYQYWETPSQNLNQFIRGFNNTEDVRLLVDPTVTIEGAAGSSFANVSMILSTRRRNGTERAFAGCYVMRKSNVQDAQNRNRWRINRAKVVEGSPRATLPELLRSTCK